MDCGKGLVYDGNGQGQFPDLDIADQAEELYSLVNGVTRL